MSNKFFDLPDILLFLAAAFLLFSCEPVGSSRGPSKKTEAEALQALETETEELGKKIELEIDARAKYVKAGGTETAMLRLLRRIVVLGQTPQQQLDDLYKKWKDAKKTVEQVEQKIKSLIAELKNMESETAKNAATKTKENVEKL